MSATRIRRVTADDAAALAELEAAAFEAGWDAESLRLLLAGELTIGWRRDEGDRLVASLLVRLVAGEGEVLRVAVHPEARRRGHARALLSVLVSSLAADLPYGLHLEVRASNVAAIGLYASVGFVEVGRRRGYYVAPLEDAVLMRWARPGA